MNDPPRILVVDDNEMNRDIIVTRLERHGYETFQAADGEEALAAAKPRCPDLVLLDLTMPHLDGIQTSRRLQGMSGCCRVIAVRSLSFSVICATSRRSLKRPSLRK